MLQTQNFHPLTKDGLYPIYKTTFTSHLDQPNLYIILVEWGRVFGKMVHQTIVNEYGHPTDHTVQEVCRLYFNGKYESFPSPETMLYFTAR